LLWDTSVSEDLAAPTSGRSEDGGSKVLRNDGIVQQQYMASQPRTLHFYIDVEKFRFLNKLEIIPITSAMESYSLALVQI
jgi:hypothetical protein